MKFVYKPKGILGTKIAEDYKNKLGKNKVCICGKLDPMAQGKLLLLFDEECKKMDENLEHKKTYQFKIAWGFQTDTDDTLGLITEEKNINENKIKKLVNNMEKYIEKYEGVIINIFINIQHEQFIIKMVRNIHYGNGLI